MGLKLKILIINANPKTQSFCRSLAESYLQGCDGQKHQVELVNLGELDFDPVLREGYFSKQPIEPDLESLKHGIANADHFVFVYPNWWGAMPALLKGMLDRILVPGFAFSFQDGKLIKLMKQKTASLLITMDVPIWIYRWRYGRRGTKLMRDNVLGFCGVKIKTISYFGPLQGSEEDTRRRWIIDAQKLGKMTA